MASAHIADATGADFVRSRKGRTHIDNCTSGYRTRPGKLCQIHHVLCIKCLTDGEIKCGDKPYIRKCMKITNWDINAAPNVIGLPLKRAFKYRPDDPAWDGYPCHQIDHNPHYTMGVSKWLNDNVWKELKAKKKECTVKGEDIAAVLKDGSDEWRGFLKKRGKKKKGTAHCWKHRNEPGMESKWYVPFSMHPGTPPPRKPIPEPTPALKKLFQLLG